MEAIQIISNTLSVSTILSCVLLKVPQIMSVRTRKSADGIYLQAMLMEIYSYTVVALYNYMNSYALMTYLEYHIILVQLYVLLYFVLLYKGLLHRPLVFLLVPSYIFTVLAFLLEIFPKILLSYILPLCTPASSFAKLTYIYGMVKQGNAETVSLATWVISASSNLARLFTVYVDSADINLMINFGISSFLSMSVFATAFFYKQAARRRSASHSDNQPDDQAKQTDTQANQNDAQFTQNDAQANQNDAQANQNDAQFTQIDAQFSQIDFNSSRNDDQSNQNARFRRHRN